MEYSCSRRSKWYNSERRTYDAWGVCTIISDISDCEIAQINPYRYRSYYFDTEIGMYYLRSRYYDPVVGRFIDADESIMLLYNYSYNIFTYCSNDSVNAVDFTGICSTSGGKFSKKNIFIVYDKAGNDFNEQANWMIKDRYNKKDCEIYKVIYIDDFVDAWNSLVKRKKDINDIYLYLHGGAGCLYFNGQTYKSNQMYDDLGELTVHGKVFLNSCNGGSSVEGGWSVAITLAMLCPGAYVRAVVNGKVYYRSFTQLFARKPLTKEKNAYWADFMYVKNYNTIQLSFVNKNRKWE